MSQIEDAPVEATRQATYSELTAQTIYDNKFVVRFPALVDTDLVIVSRRVTKETLQASVLEVPQLDHKRIEIVGDEIPAVRAMLGGAKAAAPAAKSKPTKKPAKKPAKKSR